jgi:thiol:disulfide interchange protein DsbD
MPRQASISLLCLLLLPGLALSQLDQRQTGSLSSRPEPLPIDQAFPFFVSIESAQEVTVTWQPAPAHYLYRHQFAFALRPANVLEEMPLSATLPEGLQKTDQFFGDIEAYYDFVVARLPLTVEAGTADTLIIRFQGCADWGFCYPPRTVEYPLNP